MWGGLANWNAVSNSEPEVIDSAATRRGGAESHSAEIAIGIAGGEVRVCPHRLQ
jgi:hypothetical protein